MAIGTPARHSPLILASWYRFVPLQDCESLKADLLGVCARRELRGTILLSPEGMNGDIAGRREDVRALLAYLRSLPSFEGLTHREAAARSVPFHRLKIRLKKEIISLGSTLSPGAPVGVHVEPEAWNELLSDPEVLLLDVRNGYEVGVGTFEGAVDTRLGSFREFPSFVRQHLDLRSQPKVAMFCTGGIRCEKASALMLEQGFRELYQLRGGILGYLDSVPEQRSLWRGECFVFDQRVSVGHGGAAGRYEQCYTCRHPVGPEDHASPAYEEGVSCPNCFVRLDAERARRSRERHRQVKLARSRGEAHIGAAQRM